MLSMPTNELLSWTLPTRISRPDCSSCVKVRAVVRWCKDLRLCRLTCTLSRTVLKGHKLRSGLERQLRQARLSSRSLVVHRLDLVEPMDGEDFQKSTLLNRPIRMNRESRSVVRRRPCRDSLVRARSRNRDHTAKQVAKDRLPDPVPSGEVLRPFHLTTVIPHQVKLSLRLHLRKGRQESTTLTTHLPRRQACLSPMDLPAAVHHST